MTIEQITIAGIEEARCIDKSDFDAVVTVCQDCIGSNVPGSMTYHCYNMSDGPNNEYGGDSSYELFHSAASTVETLLDNRFDVLVHCHMGRSRSTSVAAAALAGFGSDNYIEAAEKVRSIRPQMQPCQHLIEHAKRYAAGVGPDEA